LATEERGDRRFLRRKSYAGIGELFIRPSLQGGQQRAVEVAVENRLMDIALAANRRRGLIYRSFAALAASFRTAGDDAAVDGAVVGMAYDIGLVYRFTWLLRP
jgi:hypothetical protein